MNAEHSMIIAKEVYSEKDDQILEMHVQVSFKYLAEHGTVDVYNGIFDALNEMIKEAAQK